MDFDGGSGNQQADAGAGALTASSTVIKSTAGDLTLAGTGGVSVTGGLIAEDGNLIVTDALDAGSDVMASGSVALNSTAAIGGSVSGVGITFADAATFDGGAPRRSTG